MTMYSVIIPYLGSAAKGAGVATLLMISFQLWHMSEKVRLGSLPPRMPASVDFCPTNFTAMAPASNTSLTHERGSSTGFVLTQLSAYWSNFFSTILTIVIGLIISLLTGKCTQRYSYTVLINMS
ncbi:hypothetical protein IscW_ISCW002800 [Ixodes scapularis]|uniref:Uncharacterized protein n=1 Tax=Ixodes scapularis TaxID=6945 RepID=B7PD27_IXOSC|nr:hypothetical protein IscW_ISCW002800 [Ixodes scapularis]|eukprot:XP_002410584.1 hypothetical protein IscW_ISCW002800 [Ixodes scapularis]